MQNLRPSGPLAETMREYAQKIFLFAIIPTVGLFGYLLYGLFTGQLANASAGPEAAHALVVIQQTSFWLNISLAVAIICSLFLYWDEDSLGYVLLGLGALLAFGLKFSIDFLFSSDAAKLTNNPASLALLAEMKLAGMMIGVPGMLLVLKQLVQRVIDSRAQDLTQVTYGKDTVKSNERPQALVGAFAACWQLPFCRDALRPNCPIFLAKTKCWKEQVGCMCEENVMLLAMGGEDRSSGVNLVAAGEGKAPAAGGFVPIGDLITQNSQKTRASMTFRTTSSGVKIPTNPHLSSMQKLRRCHNCIIFNEHQRQKYQLFSGPVTLAVPVIVMWQFQNLLALVESLMRGIDGMIGHLSFSGNANSAGSITQAINGSVPVESLILGCLTIVAMTWAQKILEYCVFKLRL